MPATALSASPPSARSATVRVLSTDDDVATVLAAVGAGTELMVDMPPTRRRIVAREDIPAGHKLALRAMAEGVRVRKYGECIGRLTRPVAEGEWVHDHNLTSTARRAARDEGAWTAGAGATTVHMVGDVRADLGTGALYDEDQERLWWVDAGANPAIHAIDLARERQRTWPLHVPIGAIALDADECLLAIAREGVAWFDPATGSLSEPTPPGRPLTGDAPGAATIDPRGDLWWSTSQPGSGVADGAIHHLRRDLACTQVAGDLVAPAGLVFDAAGTSLHVSDTRRGLIVAYDVDAGGVLRERRVLADLGTLPGGPGGGALDADGCTWWTLWQGGAVVRLRPDGTLDRIVRLPVSRPTSCAFGGAGLRRLFVTTAAQGTSASDEPLAGRLLALDVGVAGVVARAFRREGTTR